MNNNAVDRYPRALRCLHWSMAVLLLIMLFMGVSMVNQLSGYDRLLALHKPLGLLLLGLALIRLIWRWCSKVPSLPETLPRWQRGLAHGTHALLYLLMLAQPLVGWGLLSAGGYPVSLGFGWVMPPLVAPEPHLYAVLRPLHTFLAYSLFGLILGHVGAALLHSWIYRDGVMARMLGTLRLR